MCAGLAAVKAVMAQKVGFSPTHRDALWIGEKNEFLADTTSEILQMSPTFETNVLRVISSYVKIFIFKADAR